MSRGVGGQREREDMRRWIRGEFDKWRHITDEVCVKDTTHLIDLFPRPCCPHIMHCT